MNTQIESTTVQNLDSINLLNKFAHKRPGLDPRDYGGGLDGWRLYRREAAEISRDLSDFRELLRLALMRYENRELNKEITEYLQNNSGRLTLNGNKLQYITGQYFPTEFRPACSRVLVSLIWKSYQTEKNGNGSEVYKTGHDIRKAIKRNLSRRVSRLYFN